MMKDLLNKIEPYQTLNMDLIEVSLENKTAEMTIKLDGNINNKMTMLQVLFIL
jgi:hypothetical protein